MKKKNFFKLFVGFIVIISLTLGFVTDSFAKVSNIFGAKETDGYVTISIEKFTLGRGYIKEPITVPFTEGETVAQLVTKLIGDGNYDNTGTVDSGFYLSRIKDEDDGEVNVPQYILDECGGSVDERSDNEWLGEFDYTSQSGWMYCVNNLFPNYGCSDYKLEDGDVIRWQFTVCGYGADIGGGYAEDSNGNGTFGYSYIPIADKDTLTKQVGDINGDEDKDEILSNLKVKSAYDNAYTVLEKVDSSQDDVDKASEELSEAMEDYNNDGDNEESVQAVELPISVDSAISTTGNLLCTTCTNPSLGTSGGEWTVLSLARAGYPVPDGYYDTYYSNVENEIKEKNGVLSTVKYTEYSRVILGLTSIGKDITDVGGYNLLDYMSDLSKIKKQGINGPIFALIALDTKNYEIPQNDSASEQATRQNIIDYILSKEINTGTDQAGGWALSGTTPDPDITAMALQALAKYKDDEEVKPYIDRAVQKLSELQLDDGGYASWGSVNSESIAQVITALTALGIDPKTDSRFIKNGNWCLSAIMNFYVPETGGFKHVLGDTEANGMATDQGMYALVAYSRFVNGKTSLYNMTDVDDNTIGTGDSDIENGQKVKLSVPDKISGKAGTEFNVNLSLGSFPAGDIKLLDGIIDIPDGIEVTGVQMNDANISGGLPDFGVENNMMRFIYGNTTLDNITLLSSDFPSDILTINCKVKEDMEDESKLSFKVENFEAKSGSEDSDISKWDVSESEASTEIAKIIKATARVLFNGDGTDLIPLDKKAVAVEFVNIEGTPKVIFNDSTEMQYSEELSNKNGIQTYVALVDSLLELNDFNNIDKYLIDSSMDTSTLKFGDVNNDSIVNAQDALNTLSSWLRKSAAPEGNTIIRMNVTGDSKINTSDALGIMENYVNGKEYAVLNN